jgi:oligoribonuclease NrnB/cAMP/cGMP phosphodiesterase (DHH superfamily)
MKDIVILYHGSCTDGFGAAYAAWKKFGNEASYLAVNHQEPVPAGVAGREVYVVDFSYPKDELLALERSAKKLVVLDHHIGSKDAVESAKEHIFDNDRSGAGIAWGYFHPDEPLPRLLAYVQDNDLWRFALPHAREVASYLGNVVRFDFGAFDTLMRDFEDETKFARCVELGRVYREQFDSICEKLAEAAQEVLLDGHTVLAVNAPRLFRSELGHLLAQRKGPFSIVWYAHAGSWHFSLRGDGSIDLSHVAKKFSGGGHRNAASFRIPFDQPLPFTLV